MNNYPTDSSPTGQNLDTDEQARQNATLCLLEMSRAERRFSTTQNFVNREDVEMQNIDDGISDSEAASMLMTMRQSEQAKNLPHLSKVQEGNVHIPSPDHKKAAEPASNDDLILAPECSPSNDTGKQVSTSRGGAQKRVSSDSGSDEYIPSQYRRSSLNAPTKRACRRTRNAQQMPTSSPSSLPPTLPSTTFSVPPPALSHHNLNVDPDKAFMPSADNAFRFKYDSPTGRKAAELDTLLKLPPHPKQFPANLRGMKAQGMKLSYRQLGAMPKKGLADELVAQMEAEHRRRIEEYEKEQEEDE